RSLRHTRPEGRKSIAISSTLLTVTRCSFGVASVLPIASFCAPRWNSTAYHRTKTLPEQTFFSLFSLQRLPPVWSELRSVGRVLATHHSEIGGSRGLDPPYESRKLWPHNAEKSGINVNFLHPAYVYRMHCKSNRTVQG